MPRLAAPTVLIACAAALLAAPSAFAQPKLPPGADTPPDLPAGVIVAENPHLTADSGQARAGFVASAARARSNGGEGERKRPFWATVNICDTQKSPNALGVRTSIPGNGSEEIIFARYTAQWWSAADQKWLTVGGSGVTDWVRVGTADMTSRQAGWTFRFVQPPQGTTYVMRGIVELQWRDQAKAARKARKGRRAGKTRRAHKQHRAHRQKRHRKARRAQHAAVVRTRTLLTETGMKGVQGGDPTGLSKAMCLIW